MIGMAFKMTRDTRKSLKNGLVCPVKSFDTVNRRHIDRPSDGINLHGRLCCTALKTGRFPAAVRLLTAQIPSHHTNQINEA